MFIWDVLVAFLVALLFVGLLVSVIRWGRPGRNVTATTAGEEASSTAGAVILFLFVLLFLGIWAGGAWIEPFGPTVWGVAWVPFFFIGLILAMLVAAAAPPTRWRGNRRRKVGPIGNPDEATPEEVRREHAKEALAVTFGFFFWVLVGLFVVALLFAYL